MPRSAEKARRLPAADEQRHTDGEHGDEAGHGTQTLALGAEPAGDQVDRDVLAPDERVAGGEHDEADQQVADQLVHPDDRLVEEVAHDHRVADQRQRDQQQDGAHGDAEPAEEGDALLCQSGQAGHATVLRGDATRSVVRASRPQR